LSTDFTPLTPFTICSAFAFVAAELMLSVKPARASLKIGGLCASTQRRNLVHLRAAQDLERPCDNFGWSAEE
jgi:hypothetical protein